MAAGDEERYTPSTDKETCGILGLHSELALSLRHVRIIDHVLKSVLRPPDTVERPKRGQELPPGSPPIGAIIRRVDGRRQYSGGHASFVCADQRLRSHFQQVKETGRAAAARPPLQNLAKRREDDYRRIQGPRYRWPIRSFITSNTDPEYGEQTVLIEADYKGAELFAMAVMARDENMIDHCLRANLPDGDPNQYDIHSNVAVDAFRLNCAPTKDGLASLGEEGKRISAKNIIFGIGYGRGAEACARQAQEEGVDISPEEAQAVITAIFNRYPRVPLLQETIRDRVLNPSWIRNCFGRYRRVIPVEDRQGLGELERQLLNFPMQSQVADAVSYALHYLMTHPRKRELGYRIVLQIHDAVLLEVPLRSVDTVYHEVLPECMVDRISFRASDCDGVPYPDSPVYRFDIDRSVQTNWGVKLTWDQCDQLGISRDYGRNAA